MSKPPEGLPRRLVRELLRVAGATALEDVEELQELWSGYGRILRCMPADGPHRSVIAKHVRWPSADAHPRGWASDRGHERKVRSYRVERVFYERYARRTGIGCRVPACLGSAQAQDDQLLVLEDLDVAGFPGRRTETDGNDAGFAACLDWLARFHVAFLDVTPDGLWPVGTYWHLETRPDELLAVDDAALVEAAPELDRILRSTRFSTLVHGDAKLANFCFAPDANSVAAVDFQYVGGGCGMKDLAYFVSSCFDETECERQEPALLDTYFASVRRAVQESGRSASVADDLEAEWRPLYPVAWTDFYRFLKGWSPGHWKLHRYSERLARRVVRSL